MRTFTATQQSIVDATSKTVSWLFTIVVGITTYRWSTKTKVFGGNTYSFKVLPDTFQGIHLTRNAVQKDVIAPNWTAFSISNKNNALAASSFLDGTMRIDLVVSAGSDEEIIRTWRFVVVRCETGLHRLDFYCEDFVQKYLFGTYPNTRLIRDLSQSDDTQPSDTVCVPVPFGTVYPPLRSVYVNADSQRFYVLGPTAGGETYTITNVRTPMDVGDSEFPSGTFTFTQSTKDFGGVNYRVFEPIIADTNGDGTVDSIGLWKKGETYLDMPTEFTRSDLSSITDPAAVLEYVLEDFGIASADLDTGVASTFAAATTTYAGWSLEFNGAFFSKQDRMKVLFTLLTMCHSCLDITDKVELRVLSKTSQKTLTDADILRQPGTWNTSFNYSPAQVTSFDSGYIAFQTSGNPQDTYKKTLVTAKSGYSCPSFDVLEIPFVQDTQDAQRIGILFYQRNLLVEGRLTFNAKSTCLGIDPDDVITLNDSLYGGNYAVLVEAEVINRDISVTLTCIKFSQALDDWGDLSPTAVVVNTDATSSANIWTPVFSGPDTAIGGSQLGNILPGKLRVGETSSCVIIDPAAVSLESGDYVAGAMGAGFHLDPALLEVGNISCRGLARTFVFQKTAISAIGGNLLVRPADVLNANIGTQNVTVWTDTAGLTWTDTAGLTWTDSTEHIITILGTETFAINDILRMKTATDDEWLKVVEIHEAPIYVVQRDLANSYVAGSNPSWQKGTAVVNYGSTSGAGFVYLTSSDSNAPFMSVSTHVGSPWTTVTERLRIGNLNGFLDYATALYGIGIGETDAYLKYDPTNGLRVKGNITASTGTIGGFTLSSTQLYSSTNIVIDSSDKYIAIKSSTFANAGIQLQYNSGTPRMYCGDGSNNYLKFDGTKVSISSSNADALILKSGGDMTLEGSDTDPGELIFKGSSYSVKMFMDAAGQNFYIYPATNNAVIGYLGGYAGLTNRFVSLNMEAVAQVSMTATETSGGETRYTTLQCLANSANGSKIYLSTSSNDGTERNANLYLKATTSVPYRAFYPASDADIDLGKSSLRWNEFYCFHLNEGCALLDVVDDLEILKTIKPLVLDGKALYTEEGFPRMDVLSLPDPFTNIERLAEELSGESGLVITAQTIRDIKNGIKSPLIWMVTDEVKKEQREYVLDAKAIIARSYRRGSLFKDLAVGAIKQLDKRIEYLETELKTIKDQQIQ